MPARLSWGASPCALYLGLVGVDFRFRQGPHGRDDHVLALRQLQNASGKLALVGAAWAAK